MKKILSILGMLLPILATAQVTLQPSLPAVGLIQKDQLWNVLLVNSTTQQYDCRLVLLLRDRASGQEILTASTGQFVLQPGARQMNVNTLAPIQYNYILAGFDGRQQGLLPAGSYTACYSLSSATVKETSLADDCVQFDTEPLTPPMLVYPTDSSVLETAPNQFSWIPPTPSGMFNRLQYDVLISPINDGQKAAEAIEENLPFYSEGGHVSTMLNYSGASPVFEKDKWYAWQVVARDGREYAGKSEVWVFKVEHNDKKDSASIHYFVLKSNGNEEGICYLNSHYLNIKYYSFDKAQVLRVRFRNGDRQIIKQIQQNTVYGDNFFNFKLDASFVNGQQYIIELIDGKGIIYSATFTITQ